MHSNSNLAQIKGEAPNTCTPDIYLICDVTLPRLKVKHVKLALLTHQICHPLVCDTTLPRLKVKLLILALQTCHPVCDTTLLRLKVKLLILALQICHPVCDTTLPRLKVNLLRLVLQTCQTPGCHPLPSIGELAS